MSSEEELEQQRQRLAALRGRQQQRPPRAVAAAKAATGAGESGAAQGERRLAIMRMVLNMLKNTPDDGRGMVGDLPVSRAGLERLMQRIEQRRQGTGGGRQMAERIHRFLTEEGDDDAPRVDGVKVPQLRRLLARARRETTGGR